MRTRQKTFGFVIFCSLISFSCTSSQQKTTPDSGSGSSSSSGSGGGQNSGTNTGTKIILSTTSTDMNESDAEIAAAAKRSQNAILRSQIPRTSMTTLQRTDQFYKCGSKLSHGFVDIDTTKVQTGSEIAQRFQSSLVTFNRAIRETKLGAYEAYAAGRSTDKILYVFFTADDDHLIYYAQKPDSGTWSPLKKLTDYAGIPTVSFDLQTKNLIAKIYSAADSKVYSYVLQGSATPQKSADGPVVSLEDFDKTRAIDGTNWEIGGITQDSIETSSAPSLLGTIFSRALNAAFTFGASELAVNFHKEENLDSVQAYIDIKKYVCP